MQINIIGFIGGKISLNAVINYKHKCIIQFLYIFKFTCEWVQEELIRTWHNIMGNRNSILNHLTEFN